MPSLTFGRASALPCRRDCAVQPAAMQLNSLILRFINKPSIKKKAQDCLPQHSSSMIWRGLNIPANLLGISRPAVAAPSAQRGATFRPPLMWRPDATKCCASCNPLQILRSWQTGAGGQIGEFSGTMVSAWSLLEFTLTVSSFLDDSGGDCAG